MVTTAVGNEFAGGIEKMQCRLQINTSVIHSFFMWEAFFKNFHLLWT